jgi:hypothetical protein
VALLAVFDSYSPREITGRLPIYLRLVHQLQRVWFQLGNVAISNYRYSYRCVWEKASTEMRRLRVRVSLLVASLRGSLRAAVKPGYWHMEIGRINDRAHIDYRPVPYNGSAVLFKPRAGCAGFSDPQYGWGKLARKGVRVIDMPCYPRGALNEPFMSILADLLKAEIAKAAQDA